MKPKLLISTDCFLPRWDGIARFLSETLNPLAKTFDITVIAPDFPGEKPKFHGKLINFPLGRLKFGDYRPARTDIRKIEELVKESDIIFNQTVGPIGYETVKEAKKQKKPIAYFVHSIEWELISKSVKFGKSIVRIVAKWITRRMHNSCQLLFLPYMGLSHILGMAGIKTKSKVVPLGVNTNKFHPMDKAECREKKEIPKDSFVIGYLGRIGREKSLDTLYDAFCELKKSIENIYLVIVGEGIREPKKMFQDPNVIVTGSTTDVETYLNTMDIYVLPSLTETTSLTTLEAMSTGLPVVVTPVGAIPSYVESGHNGFIFEPKQVQQLITLLLKLHKNPELREEIGKQARQTVMTGWTWKNTTETLTEELLKLSRTRL